MEALIILITLALAINNKKSARKTEDSHQDTDIVPCNNRDLDRRPVNFNHNITINHNTTINNYYTTNNYNYNFDVKNNFLTLPEPSSRPSLSFSESEAFKSIEVISRESLLEKTRKKGVYNYDY